MKYYKKLFSVGNNEYSASVHISPFGFRIVPKRLSDKKMDAISRIHLFI